MSERVQCVLTESPRWLAFKCELNRVKCAAIKGTRCERSCYETFQLRFFLVLISGQLLKRMTRFCEDSVAGSACLALSMEANYLQMFSVTAIGF